jgi:hypothetical protein
VWLLYQLPVYTPSSRMLWEEMSPFSIHSEIGDHHDRLPSIMVIVK